MVVTAASLDVEQMSLIDSSILQIDLFLSYALSDIKVFEMLASSTSALPRHCKSIANALQRHCKSTEHALQKHC
jgi:hypothetical protein